MPSSIKNKLNSALIYASTTAVLGASNRSSDIIETDGWALFMMYRCTYDGFYHKASDPIPDHTGTCYTYDKQLQTISKYNKYRWNYRFKEDISDHQIEHHFITIIEYFF